MILLKPRNKKNPADSNPVQSFDLGDELSELDVEEMDAMDEDEDGDASDAQPRKKART